MHYQIEKTRKISRCGILPSVSNIVRVKLTLITGSRANGSKMDGSLVNYNEGTPSTKDKDPMILAQSYMMYKIGELLC